MDISIEFLKQLLDTPGPSGFETAPARVWRTHAEGFAESVDHDVAGNSLASLNAKQKTTVMFAGHIDEIGVMINHIDDDGYLWFSTIGGWDSQVLVGQRVVLMAKDGPVNGVIGKKAIHLIKSDERDKVSKVDDLWIDIGANDSEEAGKLIRVGDPGVISGSSVDFPNGRIVSRSIDNRIGAFTVLEALRTIHEGQKKAPGQVVAVATTREEIAWTGGGARTSANALEPKAAIVVDVTHATDHPEVEKKKYGDAKLGGGPVLSRGSAVHPVVFDMLMSVAEKKNLPVQLSAAPIDTGTDADAIHSSLKGVPTGLVSIPNRYMHSPNEMISIDDVEAAVKLLAGFALLVETGTDFRRH